MEFIMKWILCANLIASVLYTVVMIPRGAKVFLGIFFAALPVLGFLTYFLPQIVIGILGKGDYDRQSLVGRLEIEKERIMPSVKKELNVIPVEDAMAVGSNEEKRTLLLEQMKKDMNTSYKLILPAANDKDSESAHYVAAAKMEVYRRKQAKLAEIKEEWEKEPDNTEKLQKYLRELEDYISSELLANKEAKIYKEEYCRIAEKLWESQTDCVSEEECSYCLSYLADLKQYEKAERLWSRMCDNMKNEAAYRVMLGMYYGREDKQRFYQCLDELCASAIKLSPEGLALLRYWNERRQ